MSKKKNILYKCTQVKKKVKLEIVSEMEKKLFGAKPISQEVLSCDLQSMGGCSMRIERFDTKCPAVTAARKCGLK